MYIQQQKANFKPSNTAPYHSNLPQCNIGGVKNISDEKKPTYSIKDIPELTVGSFLANKNMQQAYFNSVKKDGDIQIPGLDKIEVMSQIPTTPQTNNSTLSVYSLSAQQQPITVGQMLQHTQNQKLGQNLQYNNLNPNQFNLKNTKNTINSMNNINQQINFQLSNQNKVNLNQLQSDKPQDMKNTPKGFYTPPASSDTKDPSNVQSLTNTIITTSTQQTPNYAKKSNINIQTPNYPSITNYNIQNYNINNYTNISAPSKENNGSLMSIQDDQYASSNLNLTTKTGKSINIQKTSTIPKNNTLVKNGPKVRVNLSDTNNSSSDSSNIWKKDYIPLKNHNILTNDAPDSLKSYVLRSFENCNSDSDRKKCEQALQRIISNAKKKGQLTTRNWNKFPLPKLDSHIEEKYNTSNKSTIIINLLIL